MEDNKCIACGDAPADEDWACHDCRKRYPPSLIKACRDKPWDYALCLRTGEVIRFKGATISGDYATLHGDGTSPGEDGPAEGLPFPCPRGVDVRVEDIVWCADAPEGS